MQYDSSVDAALLVIKSPVLLDKIKIGNGTMQKQRTEFGIN